jgi:hypothetical protein
MFVVGQEDKPSLEELKHFGVKGMKWGVHRSESSGGSSGGSAGPDKKQLRALDKQSREKDKAARDAEIETARQRYNDNARSDYLKAKDQYKVDKKTIGKREAAKKFDAVKLKNMSDFEIANQAKSGAETVGAILGVVGTVALAGLLSAASKR